MLAAMHLPLRSVSVIVTMCTAMPLARADHPMRVIDGITVELRDRAAIVVAHRAAIA
jgi:hypothetical protein